MTTDHMTKHTSTYTSTYIHTPVNPSVALVFRLFSALLQTRPDQTPVRPPTCPPVLPPLGHAPASPSLVLPLLSSFCFDHTASFLGTEPLLSPPPSSLPALDPPPVPLVTLSSVSFSSLDQPGNRLVGVQVVRNWSGCSSSRPLCLPLPRAWALT